MQRLGRRIERSISLYYYLDSKRWKVQTHRPCGRNWAWHTYRPTSASLERVKKIVGYRKNNYNGWGSDGSKIVYVEYFIIR